MSPKQVKVPVGQKAYKVLQPITPVGDGSIVIPGETIVLTPEQAAVLLPAGIVEEVSSSEEVSDGPNNWSN